MRSKTVSRQINPKRRKRNRGFGPFIFFIVVVVILSAGGFAAFKYVTGDNYDSESSFQRYANRYFEDASESDDIGEFKREYNYSKYASTAASYPEIGLKNVDDKTKAILGEIREEFTEKYGSEGNKKVAMLTSCDTYKSDKETGSVIFKTSVIEENDKGKLEQKSNKVKAFSFNIKNGSEIYPIMAFDPGYREKLAKLFEKEGYPKAASADISYDNFALTNKGGIFFFDAGVVDDSDKICKIEVNAKDAEKVFRDEINPRGIDPTKPMVALTYDDGPKKGTTGKILDTLEKNSAVATFFELGENVDNVQDSKKYLERMEKLNCEIGSHSYNHPNLFTISDEKIKEQNDLTDKAIESRIGKKPTVYRPPYGNGNENITKLFGKPGILWSVDTLDWKYRNAASVVDVIKNSGNLDGKVVLMHSIYDSTANATEQIVPWLQSKGYQLVTVSELLMYKYNEDPEQPLFYGYGYFYPN